MLMSARVYRRHAHADVHAPCTRELPTSLFPSVHTLCCPVPIPGLLSVLTDAIKHAVSVSGDGACHIRAAWADVYPLPGCRGGGRWCSSLCTRAGWRVMRHWPPFPARPALTLHPPLIHPPTAGFLALAAGTKSSDRQEAASVPHTTVVDSSGHLSPWLSG